MAKDTVILSPEFNNVGRREALAVGTVIETGAFVQYASGGFVVATSAQAASMISVNNISVAADLDYQYAVGENVFAQVVPRGALANVKAAAATYNAGDELEIGSGGILVAQTAGVTVAVVPSFGGETISTGDSLLVQLV